MTEPKHTPTPWHVSAGQLVINQGGKWTSDQDDILYVNEEVGDAEGFANRAIAEANAEFVCRACNMHYKLVQVVESLLQYETEAANGIDEHGGDSSFAQIDWDFARKALKEAKEST